MALSKYPLPDFKFLFSMAVGYAVVSMMTYVVIHMEFIHPLAHLDRCLINQDYLSWFMVCTEIFYAKRVAQILHPIPILLFFVLAFACGLSHSWVVTLCELMKGFLFHAVGVILAIIVPVVFSLLRIMFSSKTMNWFAHPYLAFMTFIPCSLIGLIIPTKIWIRFPLSQHVAIVDERSKVVFQINIKKREALSDEARFWGAFGFYAILTLAYLLAGLSGGFVTFFARFSMLPSWISFCLSNKSFDRHSLRSTVFYILPLVPCLAYDVYFGGFLVQFVIEKMGMMSSLPLPHGHYVPDMIVAAVIGAVTAWSVSPLMPICGHWLARQPTMHFLLHLTVLGLAISPYFSPYSASTPKII